MGFSELLNGKQNGSAGSQFLPVAESQVYEQIFDFLQIKKNFWKLPVPDSQAYERTVELFLMFLCK